MHACMQTGESWQRAVECKAKGALNLDQACQAAPDLEHFVMFSSMVAWCGNEGASVPLYNIIWPAEMMGRVSYLDVRHPCVCSD